MLAQTDNLLGWWSLIRTRSLGSRQKCRLARITASRLVVLRSGLYVLPVALGWSRPLAGIRRCLSRGAWLFPRCCRSFSRFGCGFNRRWQFQLGLFRGPMRAMMQRLDARSFIFHPQLSVSIFLALVLKVRRNRFRCHGQSVAELSPSKLCNFGHFGNNSLLILHSLRGQVPSR